MMDSEFRDWLVERRAFWEAEIRRSPPRSPSQARAITFSSVYYEVLAKLKELYDEG